MEVASNFEAEILAGYLTESVKGTPAVAAQRLQNLPEVPVFTNPKQNLNNMINEVLVC